MSWTSEPWQQWEDHPDIFAGAITHNDPFRLSGGERVAEFATDDDGCDRGVANAARAVACVNACVGIADPAQYLATLRARVAELEGKSEREHSSRVFYQDLVYKACNVVDEALGRCVGNGTRTSDVGMPDGVREMASRLYAKLAWRYAHDCARKYVVACDVYRGALPASDGGRGPSPSDLASLWQKWDEARKDAEHADELAKKDALAGKESQK